MTRFTYTSFTSLLSNIPVELVVPAQYFGNGVISNLTYLALVCSIIAYICVIALVLKVDQQGLA